jgi:hypothetical protein
MLQVETLIATALRRGNCTPILAIPLEGREPLRVRAALLRTAAKGLVLTHAAIDARGLTLSGHSESNPLCQRRYTLYPIARAAALMELHDWATKQRRKPPAKDRTAAPVPRHVRAQIQRVHMALKALDRQNRYVNLSVDRPQNPGDVKQWTDYTAKRATYGRALAHLHGMMTVPQDELDILWSEILGHDTATA